MKEWIKPKLISLYRGKPQEAVLFGCKIEGVGGQPDPTPIGDPDPPDDQWLDCDAGPIDDCKLADQS